MTHSQIITKTAFKACNKSNIFKEKRRMEEKIAILETQLNALETTNKKYESSLSTTSHESLQLEKRLNDERQKISAMRLEKKQLSEKVVFKAFL